MVEIISLKYGVNISNEHARKALVDINPVYVSIRKKKTIKRKTYEKMALLMCSILMEMIN